MILVYNNLSSFLLSKLNNLSSNNLQWLTLSFTQEALLSVFVQPVLRGAATTKTNIYYTIPMSNLPIKAGKKLMSYLKGYQAEGVLSSSEPDFLF